MHPKCEATGKAVFPSVEEARHLMYLWRQPSWDKVSGLRIKHRRGRPAQKRIYPCPYCNSYHLTSWTLDRFYRYKSINVKRITVIMA